MKFVPELTEAQREYLQTVWKTSPNRRESHRAHAILLSSQGYQIDTLAEIFDVHRNTISYWLDRWLDSREDLSDLRLEDAPRPGRPLSYSPRQQQVLLEAIEREPRNVSQALGQVKKKRVSR